MTGWTTPTTRDWFQSSPASKGRRYRRHQRRAVPRACFNPRLPRKAGATNACLELCCRDDVSILACLERQALRCNCWKGALFSSFQSSPASKGRRYLNSPRPSRHIRSFQSSPASKGRRYQQEISNEALVNGFNPRLPRKAGATTGRRGCTALLIVSILACLERQALQRGHFRAGDHLRVSILACLERQALRNLANHRQNWPMFQSSPASKGRRYMGSVRDCAEYIHVSILACLERQALRTARRSGSLSR